MKSMQIRTIAYWAATLFGPASFVMGGALGVMHDASVMTTLQHLGYPPYSPPSRVRGSCSARSPLWRLDSRDSRSGPTPDFSSS